MTYNRQTPRPLQVGDELVLSWEGNENQRVAHRDGWTFRFGSWRQPLLIDGEFWRVQVERINPSRREVMVRPLGPDPRAVWLITQLVWHIDIRTLEGERLLLGRVCHSHFEGQEGTVDCVSELGHEYLVRIEQMRLYQRGLIGLVHFRRNFQVETRLACVFLEYGSPVPFPEHLGED